MSDIVFRWLEAQKSHQLLKTFINTSLGECFDDSTESVDPDSLIARCEDYELIPEGAYVLTCGVDVQDNRLEAEVVAWGKDYESWSIDYQVFSGSTAIEATVQDNSLVVGSVWQQLDAYIKKQWIHENGVALKISRTCIDSGGHRTNDVYRFCKPRRSLGVYPIKGQSLHGKPVSTMPKKANEQGVYLVKVGSDTAKSLIYHWLENVTEAGAEFCHFSKRVNDAKYFKMLTAERKERKLKSGQYVDVWIKPEGVRNEALDCRVYALAALELMVINWQNLIENMQALAEAKQMQQVKRPAAEVRQQQQNDSLNRAPRSKLKGYTPAWQR